MHVALLYCGITAMWHGGIVALRWHALQYYCLLSALPHRGIAHMTARNLPSCRAAWRTSDKKGRSSQSKERNVSVDQKKEACYFL